MFFGPVVKGMATALCGAIASEIGFYILRWLENHCQLINSAMKAISKVINGLDLSFTAEQAAAGAFAAHLNVVVATGVAAVSLSIIVGGMALGVKAYWKGRGLNGADAEMVELVNAAEEEIDFQFQERPSPILHQAQSERLRQNFQNELSWAEFECKEFEEEANIRAQAKTSLNT